MACYHPITAYRSPDGGVSFKNSTSSAWSINSFKLPCGQCRGCRLEKSRQWAIRIMHESQTNQFNSFVTLTYSDLHLPRSGSLDVKHWQDFAKRVRKTDGKFRFYHCGEYGDKTRRPHYHACIFGLDWHKDRKIHASNNGNTLYMSDSLNERWGKGNAYIGSLTYQSAAYVARYIMKKQGGEQSIEHYRIPHPDALNSDQTYLAIQLNPEYATMSRRPGLGFDWFQKYGSTDLIPNDEVIMEGKACRTPKYYDQLLEQSDPETLAATKEKRKATASLHTSNNTPERLAVRETIADAKAALYQQRDYDTAPWKNSNNS